MDFSKDSSLTPLQRDLVAEFFARERRFFLTGGAALAGFYFGHRKTEDLDLFSPPGASLEEAVSAMTDAAEALGAVVDSQKAFPEFRRLMVRRGLETCVVDLVIDRAPPVEAEKATYGSIRVDTLREIAANKLCAVLGRAEIKDLVDLQALLDHGIDLASAVADAEHKDAGADPATLAWVLAQLKIAPGALLPGNVDAVALERFRADTVDELKTIAFRRAQG